MPTAAVQPELSGHRHALTLYERDDELVGIVGGHLLAALSIGGSAVAVATAPHTAALTDWLVDHGVDVAGRRQDGRLVVLDAGLTLARLFVDDAIDSAAFDVVVGGVARAARPPCHAYGEMVDLLWAQRRVTDVLALEHLWVGLCQRSELSLLCGYSAGAIDDEFFADIRRLHDAAFHESVSASEEFGADPNSAAGARHFVRSVLHGWGRHELVDDAELIVSELASNAVIHARSGFIVTLDRGDALVRVAVTDAEPGLTSFPVPARTPPAGTHHHGLGIVALVARRWGANPAAGGKVVWADLAGAR